MKKLLSILFLLTLVSCGSGGGGLAPPTVETPPTTEVPPTTEDDMEEEDITESSTPHYSDVGRNSVTIFDEDEERYLRFEGSGDTITISTFNLDGKLINYSDDEDSFKAEWTIPTTINRTDINIDTVALTTRTITNTDDVIIQDHYLAIIKFTYRDAGGILLSQMRGFKFDRQTTSFSGWLQIADKKLTAVEDGDVESLNIFIDSKDDVFFWPHSPSNIYLYDIVFADEF